MTPAGGETMRRALATLLLSAVILFLGWLDYTTGPDIGFSVFYLLPVVAAGWRLGSFSAGLTAGLAGAAWIAADVAAGNPERPLMLIAWNGFTRVVIYGIVGFLTSRLRTDREHLRDLLDREKLLARTDPITDLPNYRGFVERLLTETSRCRRTGEPLCVAYIDLDDFKKVNDQYGHPAGDSLLAGVAGILRETVRSTDVAARLGGDEFAILFWRVDRSEVEAIITRVIEQIRDFGAGYEQARPGASAGVAYFERPPRSADDILREADGAMYEAKSRGKGTLVIRMAGVTRPESAVHPNLPVM